MQCSRCNQPIIGSGISSGYARTPDGAAVCYACCAEEDVRWMRDRGQISLYLTIPADGTMARRARPAGNRYCAAVIGNWPGSLEFKTGLVKYGRHNFAGTRLDVWFDGPDGYVWHGVSLGENTEVCHCKRTRERC